MNAAGASPTAPPGALRLAILHVADCPLVSRLRATVEMVLEGVGTTAVVEESEHNCASPTLLIDGVAIDGYPLSSEPACRLALPTDEEVAVAVLAALARRSVETRANEGST